MNTQHKHGLLVETIHDEASRQQYYMDIRRHLATKIAPGNKTIYHKKVKPDFLKKKGREPKDRHEVRGLMTKNNGYQINTYIKNDKVLNYLNSKSESFNLFL